MLTLLDVDVDTLKDETVETWHRRLLSYLQSGSADLGDHRDLLKHVKREFSTGVHAILRGDGWALPALPTIVWGRPASDRGPVRRVYHRRVDGVTDKNSIIVGLCELTMRGGETLRQCAREGCGRPFVGRRRGLFCSPTCSKKTMHQRKAAARKAARQAKRKKKGA